MIKFDGCSRCFRGKWIVKFDLITILSIGFQNFDPLLASISDGDPLLIRFLVVFNGLLAVTTLPHALLEKPLEPLILLILGF